MGGVRPRFRQRPSARHGPAATGAAFPMNGWRNTSAVIPTAIIPPPYWPQFTGAALAPGLTLQQVFLSGGNPLDRPPWLKQQLTKTAQGMFWNWCAAGSATYQGLNRRPTLRRGAMSVRHGLRRAPRIPSTSAAIRPGLSGGDIALIKFICGKSFKDFFDAPAGGRYAGQLGLCACRATGNADDVMADLGDRL